MGSMAQDAISFGLDPTVGPDGRLWCDSSYGQSDISREIWGDLQNECAGSYNNRYAGDFDDDDDDNSSNKSEGHTARVWEKMGYTVKYGETYAYKFYGNEIFTEDQVVKKGSNFYAEKKRFRKSRESETHTYDEWQELGYQVRRGERAISSSGWRYYFDRDQVAWIG